MRQIFPLVPLAAFPNHRQIRRGPIGFRPLPLSDFEIERRQVAACQVIAQVGRRQPNLPCRQLHLLHLPLPLPLPDGARRVAPLPFTSRKGYRGNTVSTKPQLCFDRQKVQPFVIIGLFLFRGYPWMLPIFVVMVRTRGAPGSQHFRRTISPPQSRHLILIGSDAFVRGPCRSDCGGFRVPTKAFPPWASTKGTSNLEIGIEARTCRPFSYVSSAEGLPSCARTCVDESFA